MKLTFMIMIMAIGSFIIQYLLMSPIMVNKLSDLTNSYGKLYMALIMVIYMLFIDIALKDYMNKRVSMGWYLLLSILLILFIYLYRYQIGINDKQYLEGMIEHHSMAILTSKEIIKKSKNSKVLRLAEKILYEQENEIHLMKEMIKYS